MAAAWRGCSRPIHPPRNELPDWSRWVASSVARRQARSGHKSPDGRDAIWRLVSGDHFILGVWGLYLALTPPNFRMRTTALLLLSLASTAAAQSPLTTY